MEMKKFAGLFAGISVLSLSLLLILTPVYSGTSIAGEKILNVGTIQPLSGPAAPWGIGTARVMTFFAEDINSAGGLKIGNDIYKIKTSSYDDKASPSEAAACAVKLVTLDKVKYIFGGVIAATGMAELPVTEPKKVVTTSCWWGKKILGPDKPFTFRQTVSQNEIAPAMYAWIAKNHPELKTIAQLNPNDTSGWDTADAIKKAAKANGLKMVANELYNRGTKDVYSFLTRILMKKPDLVELGVSTPGDGSLIVKQLYELGYKGKIAWTCGTNPFKIIQLCGAKASEGIWFSYGQKLEGPNSTSGTRALAKRYKTKFKEALAPFQVTEYAMMEIFTNAMVKAGTTDTEKVIKVVEKTHKFDTIFGPMVLIGKQKYGIDRQFVHRMMLGVAKNGQLVELQWLPLPGLGLPEY